jgi:Family of unknown function (DUF6152)
MQENIAATLVDCRQPVTHLPLAPVITAVALIACAPAWAHHSFAMFDGSKETKLVGTVKEFEWTNPHVFVDLIVSSETGAQKVWSLQMNGIAGYARRGWTHDTIKPGDHVTVVIHPLKSGEPGGLLMVIVTPDGRTLCAGADKPPAGYKCDALKRISAAAPPTPPARGQGN